MSGNEKLAAAAASDPDGFQRLASSAGSDLEAISLTRFDRGRLHSDGTRTGGTVAIGTVIMFPTNPRFRWLSDGITGNWVILEIVNISPANNARGADDEVFTLAVVGHTGAAQSEHGCFTRPPPARFFTSTLPQWLVQPLDAEGLRGARRKAEEEARRTDEEEACRRTGGTKRGSSTYPPGTCPSSPLYRSDDGDGEGNQAGRKALLDDDGFERVFSTPTVQTIKSAMRHCWRAMSDEKRGVLVPGHELDNTQWSAAMIPFTEVNAPLDWSQRSRPSTTCQTCSRPESTRTPSSPQGPAEWNGTTTTGRPCR